MLVKESAKNSPSLMRFNRSLLINADKMAFLSSQSFAVIPRLYYDPDAEARLEREGISPSNAELS